MIRRPPRSTQSRSSAASDVYKRQAAIPTGPNYHGYLFYLSEFPPGYHSVSHRSSSTSSTPSPPPGSSRSSTSPSSSNSSTSLHPSTLAGSNFASIAHIGVIAQGYAFTIPVSWVLDLLRIAHIGVTAQGYAFTIPVSWVLDLLRIAHMRQNGKSNNLIHFPQRDRGLNTYRGIAPLREKNPR